MNLAHPTPQAAEANGRSQPDPLSDAFARWQAELLGTLYHLVGNVEDARDALQETFLKCWRHRDEVGGVENLKAWIFRIALNTGRDLRGAAWRRRRMPLAEDGLLIVAQHPSAADRLERAELLVQLRRAVHELRPEEQEVFLLRQNGELTYDDIAAALGIPVGTVKTRMRLALGRLREVMEGGERGERRKEKVESGE
jgi:RNA polymerase sigma-70 factor (ECF subfamily)